ncbi:CHC2 zinc finger domain-containing protein, partial [Leptospira santarosai]
MPEYIPKEEITRLKTETDLLALVRSYGIELRKHGLNWVGRCPFHEDKTPSFIVTPTKHLWHCMGACKAGGSAIDFVMKKEGLGFQEAVELLLENLTKSTGSGNKKRPTPLALSKELGRKIPTTERVGEEERNLIFKSLEYYRTTLQESRIALSYLNTRKVG